MSKGNVVFRETDTDMQCPNCGDILYFLWTFKRGTTRAAIDNMGPEAKQRMCLDLIECCARCGYTSRR